jgi:hypothetical protein
MAVHKERSLWVARMIFTTYIIQLLALWVFSTFSATVSGSLATIGVLSFVFMTLFMAFYTIAVYVPREKSAGTMFFSFRSRLLRALSWVFGL